MAIHQSRLGGPLSFFSTENKESALRIGTHLCMLTLNGDTPQRTLFGPLSFVVYLGDLCTPEVTDYIYVDDTSCCSASTDLSSPSVQRTAEYAVEWVIAMIWNWTHRKHRSWCFRVRWHLLTLEPTVIGGEPVARVSSARLLGVTLDVKLKWDLHIESFVSEASQRVCMLCLPKKSGVLLKTWSTLTDQSSVRLWNTHVRCGILP